MATTTNFGWETPDDTDLVKDGALAIRTLGSAIDTSLVDLKGGTTGQVLSKTSNTDMDFTWVTSDDANAIQNAIVDAKGDLIAASAADTPARLAVGTNGQILTADSTTATGLKWAAPAAPTFIGCSLTKSANQTISNSVQTAVTFDVEQFDTNSFHSTSTNTSRITIPSGYAGKYLFVMKACWAASSTGNRLINYLYKNNSEFTRVETPSTGYEPGLSLVVIADAAVNDYFEFFVLQTSGGNLNLGGSASANFTSFYCAYLGA